MNIPNVKQIKSDISGPTVAVFAGVHGNELAGVYALRELEDKLKITRGTVYLVYANPPAIEKKVRMITKNLNRCFDSKNSGDTYEDLRAKELMKLLDKCDALLDLHMFYDDDGKPFAICEDDALDVAKIFDVDIISTNWTKTEPGGTDGYMHKKGKIGICLECGPLSKSEEYAEFAKNAVYQFLKYFEMTDKKVTYSKKPKRIIKSTETIYKTSKDFVLKSGLRDFDALTEGQVIAEDKDKQFVAGANQCIIFPHYNARVGEEAFILGVESK